MRFHRIEGSSPSLSAKSEADKDWERTGQHHEAPIARALLCLRIRRSDGWPMGSESDLPII
jgi:hypothetical protein